MKKHLLFLVFAMISVTASAQFTIWEDTFNDGNVSDWTLHDLDGNSSNWIARKNIQMGNSGEVIDGTKNVLGSYHIDLATGTPLSGDENNWAVSPAIDLSFYTGSIKLIINAQTAIYDGNRDLVVYVSTAADPATLQATTATALPLVRPTNDGEYFQDFVVDISQYAGQSQVHFALVMNDLVSVGLEVDNVHITATDILGTNDVTQKKFALKQNPVADYLQLQSGDLTNSTSAQLYIYNANGIQVKQAPFAESGVYVGDLSAGVYFLVITDNAITERLKFIKK